MKYCLCFPERLFGILIHLCENLASRNFEGVLPFLCSFVALKSATFLREPALDGSRVEASKLSKERIVEQQEYHNDRKSQIISKGSTRIASRQRIIPARRSAFAIFARAKSNRVYNESIRNVIIFFYLSTNKIFP